MNWQTFRNNEYGFSMQVPAGTPLSESDLGGGWGMVQGKAGPAEITAIGKLGQQHTPEEIEAYAIEQTGIPASRWSKKDEGRGQNGWAWFRTYEAHQGGAVVFVRLGVGPKGSYAVMVKTAQADYQDNQGLYLHWYNSLTLF